MDSETLSRKKRDSSKQETTPKTDQEGNFCFGSYVSDPTTTRIKKASSRSSKEKNLDPLRPIRSDSPEQTRPRKKRIGQSTSTLAQPPQRSTREGFRRGGPERTVSEPLPNATLSRSSELVSSVEDFEAWKRACDAVEKYREDGDGLGQIQETYGNYLCKAISWDGPLWPNLSESKQVLDSASTDAPYITGSDSVLASGSGDAAASQSSLQEEVPQQAGGQVSALVRRFSSLDVGEEGEVYEGDGESGNAGGDATTSEKNERLHGCDADVWMVTNVVQGRDAGMATQPSADWVVTDVYQPCDAAVMTEPQPTVQTADVGVMTPNVRSITVSRAVSDSELVNPQERAVIRRHAAERGLPPARAAAGRQRRRGFPWQLVTCLLTAVGTVLAMDAGVDLISAPPCGKRAVFRRHL
ncbi:hypothetical protein BSKO_11598 [Bryopsis sp. KO-2023]|nr:hypothetical protein BSKO_11598 [Bryopsis sp. KO-2023]